MLLLKEKLIDFFKKGVKDFHNILLKYLYIIERTRISDRLALCVCVGLDSHVGLAVLDLGLPLSPVNAVYNAADDENNNYADDDDQTKSH